MPIELTDSWSSAYVKLGDVLMVHQTLVDRSTKKPFTWKWFGIVSEVGHYGARCWRVGAEGERDHEYSVYWGGGRERMTAVFLLEPSEWPDGVCVWRMKLILEGRIEGIV